MKLIILSVVLLVVIVVIIYLGKMTMAVSKEKSLYDRLGGIYPIAAVINLFSNNLINNDIVGINSKNPQLREWHRNKLDRLPGLKFMRSLWVADITGGPFTFHSSSLKSCPFSGARNKNKLDLREAHCPFKVSSNEFDAVASELSKALDHYKVPPKEKNEVLGAFSAHKKEVVV
uniref:Globin n=1 Tax=Mimivirus LCMiAC02 TaxID=2506609 RepID=A0A481Z295_9VIRU|nr:MAG: globin [Mimivirus LCMiAC02]